MKTKEVHYKFTGSMLTDDGGSWVRVPDELVGTRRLRLLNATDVEVFDSTDGSSLVYRFQDGAWKLIPKEAINAGEDCWTVHIFPDLRG